MTTYAMQTTERLTLDAHPRLAGMYQLSPFVWKQGGEYHLLLRAVPKRDEEPRLKMAEVFYGRSRDGLHFKMDDGPVIFPGPDREDADGCEDPTVVLENGVTYVWYTGWNQTEGVGRLLMASGDSPRSLHKRGLALDSMDGFLNPKEATVVRAGEGDWKLFFEYARDEASCIGLAESADPQGPWTSRETLLTPRRDSWDCWHLSTGPIVNADSDRPVMFYNGASRDAHWRIGWAAFDRELTRVVDRGVEPLITPCDLQDGWTDIAFASSAVEEEGCVWLYHSIADRDLQRATLRIVTDEPPPPERVLADAA